MPIYEYECEKCSRIQEAIQKFSDKPLKKCDHCSGKLRKVVSHSTFHLKGTGWYVTDYANKSQGYTPPQQKKEGSSTTETKEAQKDSDKTT